MNTMGLDFDPQSADPVGLLDTLRASGERLVRSETLGGALLVLRHEDVARVLRDPVTYSSTVSLGGPVCRTNPPEVVAELPDFLSAPVSGVVDADPPHHAGQRRTLNRAWGGDLIDRLTPAIDALARELAGTLAGREGGGDLVAEFTRPFVARTMGTVMGLPPADVSAVAAWGGDLATLISPLSPLTTVQDKIDAARRLHAYVEWAETFLAPRRETPHDDPIGVYVRGADDADPLTPDEVLNTLLMHFVAGTVTTGHAIGTAMYHLLDDRARWDRVVAAPQSYAPKALEEAMRYAAPHRGLMRVTTREAELGGETLPAGTLLVPMLASANRDAAHFDDPQAFDPDRVRVRDHLAFGSGIHACVGARLARLEGRLAIGALASRLPTLRLADPGRPPAYEPDPFFHGPARLPVVW